MTDHSAQIEDIYSQDFAVLSDLIHLHAQQRPAALAIIDDLQSITWAALDAMVDRTAAALQRDQLKLGDVVAICANSSINYVTTFLGALRAGVAVAPLAPSLSPETLARMVHNSGAKLIFTDASTRALFTDLDPKVARISFDPPLEVNERSLESWLAPENAQPTPVAIDPSTPFNIIYSSGTTGEPKGIVQSHEMRWGHIRRFKECNFTTSSKTLLSTPLYSNTTLVLLVPTLAYGGCAVLMKKFNVERYLQLVQDYQITHTILVPVQYQRLLSSPHVADYDVSSLLYAFCTSAPFSAELKAEALRVFSGELVEMYGMTEGGGGCMLYARQHPDKLHTVGRPSYGSELRLIDEDGNELPTGEVGEVVGRSRTMMTCYHGKPEATKEAEWFDADGVRFIRTGDIGRFDKDGFLTLLDRRKDMIISGGFNIYPSDLEAIFAKHPSIRDVAVVGVPSAEWGETPVAFVSLHEAQPKVDAESLREWINARLGKTQRIAHVTCMDELPRSEIGKILKRELQQLWADSQDKAIDHVCV